MSSACDACFAPAGAEVLELLERAGSIALLRGAGRLARLFDERRAPVALAAVTIPVERPALRIGRVSAGAELLGEIAGRRVELVGGVDLGRRRRAEQREGEAAIVGTDAEGHERDGRAAPPGRSSRRPSGKREERADIGRTRGVLGAADRERFERGAPRVAGEGEAARDDLAEAERLVEGARGGDVGWTAALAEPAEDQPGDREARDEHAGGAREPDPERRRGAELPEHRAKRRGETAGSECPDRVPRAEGARRAAGKPRPRSRHDLHRRLVARQVSPRWAHPTQTALARICSAPLFETRGRRDAFRQNAFVQQTVTGPLAVTVPVGWTFTGAHDPTFSA